MNDNLNTFIKFMSSDQGASLLSSFILIIVLIFIRYLILQIVLKTNPKLSLEDKRRWSVNLRNIVIFCSMFGLILIWARELQSFALSIVAFAAALVLATKELIMCVSGGLVRATNKSYSLGDFIEIGPHQGRVVDINIFTTTLVELGPTGLSHRMTGRQIKFPNSLLLTYSVIKDSDLSSFILDTIVIPAPYSVDPVKAEHVVITAANKYARPYLDEAQCSIDVQDFEKLLDTPSIEPRVNMVPVDDKGYKFIVRIAIPKDQRNRIEQEIFRDFMIKCHGQSEPEEGF